MFSFRINNYRTERLIISNLTLRDALDMEGWKRHSSPLYSSYNFDDMTKSERKMWYEYKMGTHKNQYYSAREKGTLIGYFGIKNISRLFRTSDFGIVIDAGRMGEGFGSEILNFFLEIYFNDFKMRKLNLKVAEFNERAIRLYRSVGFLEKGYQLERLSEEEKSDYTIFKKHPEYFEISKTDILYYVINMERKAMSGL